MLNFVTSTMTISENLDPGGQESNANTALELPPESPPGNPQVSIRSNTTVNSICLMDVQSGKKKQHG